MNPFEVLEIQPGASPDEVKAAYHRLAKQWHPDRFTGDAKQEAEAKFRQLSEAFGMLRDAVRRGETDPGRNLVVSEGTAKPRSDASPAAPTAPDPRTKTAADWFADAKAAFEQGDVDRAQGLTQYAIRMDSRQAAYHLFLATVLEAAGGDRRAVVKALETAINLDPRDADALVHLSEVFGSLGMTARAEGLLEKVRTIAPGHRALKAPRKARQDAVAPPVNTESQPGFSDQWTSLLGRIKAAFGRSNRS